MNKINRILLAVSLSAASASTLGAQSSEGLPAESLPAEGRMLIRGQSLLMMALDRDRDGVISTEEIAHAPESILALDLNQDGRITPDEVFHLRARQGDDQGAGLRLTHLQEGNEESGPRIVLRREGHDEGANLRMMRQEEENEGRGGRVKFWCPIFKVLDIDGDGILSPDEIANSWITLLDLDADQDGVLTLDEIRPARPE